MLTASVVLAIPHHHKGHRKHHSLHRRHQREDDNAQDPAPPPTKKAPHHIIQDHDDLQKVAAGEPIEPDMVSYEKTFLLEIAAKLRKYVNTISENVQSLDDHVLLPLNRTLFKAKARPTEAPPQKHHQHHTTASDADDEEASPEHHEADSHHHKLGKNKVFRTDGNGEMVEVDLDEECDRRLKHRVTTEEVPVETEESTAEKDEEEEDASKLVTTKKPKPMDPDLTWKKRSPRHGDMDVFAEMFLNKDF